MSAGRGGRYGWRAAAGDFGFAAVLAVLLIALWEWQGWPTAWRYVAIVVVVLLWTVARQTLESRRKRRAQPPVPAGTRRAARRG